MFIDSVVPSKSLGETSTTYFSFLVTKHLDHKEVVREKQEGAGIESVRTCRPNVSSFDTSGPTFTQQVPPKDRQTRTHPH